MGHPQRDSEDPQGGDLCGFDDPCLAEAIRVSQPEKGPPKGKCGKIIHRPCIFNPSII